MADEKGRHRGLALWLNILLLIGALAAIAFNELVPEEWISGMARETVKEVGVAAVVALILANSFEKLSAHELESQITKVSDAQVGSALAKLDDASKKKSQDLALDNMGGWFGNEIPKPVKEGIKTQILSPPFCRQKVRVTYWLSCSSVGDGKQYLAVKMQSKYDVANLTDETQSLTLQPFVTKSPLSQTPSYFESFKATGCEQAIKLTKEQLAELTEDRGPDLVILLAPEDGDPLYPIDVLPKSKGKPTHIDYITHSINHLDYGSDTYSFKQCAIDLTLTVKVLPPLVHTLTVDAQVDAFTTLDTQPGTTPGLYIWKAKGPFLPYQGFRLTWTHAE